jgi:hypothetical protein
MGFEMVAKLGGRKEVRMEGIYGPSRVFLSQNIGKTCDELRRIIRPMRS